MRQSREAELEERRRSAHATQAKIAAASPLHVSKKRKTAGGEAEMSKPAEPTSNHLEMAL